MSTVLVAFVPIGRAGYLPAKEGTSPTSKRTIPRSRLSGRASGRDTVWPRHRVAARLRYELRSLAQTSSGATMTADVGMPKIGVASGSGATPRFPDSPEFCIEAAKIGPESARCGPTSVRKRPELARVRPQSARIRPNVAPAQSQPTSANIVWARFATKSTNSGPNSASFGPAGQAGR